MEVNLPSLQDIRALVAYQPVLYREGFEPVIEWAGGGQGTDGLYRLPWPEYNPVVEEFYRLVASAWLDTGYDPDEAARMLADKEYVSGASLSQIKIMLTFCVRGERFSDGHWAEMIQNGYIRQLLERLDVIGSEMAQTGIDAH
jgi:hypothetical protein